MIKSSTNLKGNLFILLSSVFFGSYGIWSKLIGESFGDFFQAWSRALMVLAVILPVGFFLKQYKSIKKRDVFWFGLVSFAGAFTFFPYFYGFRHLSIGTATFLFYAALTIGNYILGKLFFKENFGVVKILSLMLGLAGLLTIFSFSLSALQVLAAVIIVFGGLAGSTEVVFSKKISNSYSSLQVSAAMFAGTVLFNLPASLAFGETQTLPSLSTAWTAQIGYMVAQISAFTLVVLGLKYSEPSVAGIVGLLEIVFAAIFGYVVFHETLTIFTILGGFLIIISAALPSISELYQKHYKVRVPFLLRRIFYRTREASYQ